MLRYDSGVLSSKQLNPATVAVGASGFLNHNYLNANKNTIDYQQNRCIITRSWFCK